MEKEKKEDPANRDWYTQREWDRTVGYGEVPKEYSKRDS